VNEEPKRSSELALALGIVAVGGAGLLCGYFLLVAGYYLAALGIHSFMVLAGAGIAIEYWVKRKKER
jgi:hypothetical protein